MPSNKKKKNAAASAFITVWEDDPAGGMLTTAPLPDVTRQPLGYLFNAARPTPSTDTNSKAFRYWTAAEALRRGADFWAPKVSGNSWQRGTILEVYLDKWKALQASYNRLALNFFHSPSSTGTVYSGASPDLLCHELGHAILDAIRPDLWNIGFKEVAAFHESFGDMSAMLCALQLPSLRASILADTSGQLCSNSRLSRIAEQFGVALHALDPGAANPDCLRNAMNPFSYCDPHSLPPTAPATQLSSRAHSFSRIFTGALFEAFGGMLACHAANSSKPTSSELLAVSLQLRDIIVDGVVQSQAVTHYYAEVAFWIVVESGSHNPDYTEIMLGAFVRRCILSLDTAALLRSEATSRQYARKAGGEDQLRPDTVSLSATKYGLDEPLIVETGVQIRPSVARSGTSDGRSMEPASPEAAAAFFVDMLFVNGELDYGKYRNEDEGFADDTSNKTHEIVREKDGLRLRRRLINCGMTASCSACRPPTQGRARHSATR